MRRTVMQDRCKSFWNHNSIQRQRQDTIAEKFNSRPVAPTLKLNGLSHDFAAIGLSFAPGVSVGPAVLPTKFKLRADF